MNRHSCKAWLAAVALGASAGVLAQTMEISSDSIGTVRVTPAPITGAGGAPPLPAPREANNRGRTGVDLGIKRRPDGSLYDALDPTQNPAAVRAPETAGAASASAPATAGAPRAEARNPR